MNLSLYFPFIIAIGVLLVLALGLIGVVKAFYVKVPQGTALIVNDLSSTPKVHFTGALVILADISRQKQLEEHILHDAFHDTR